MIVVDSNLITYFYVRGGRTPEADAVFATDPLWVAPFLWRSEFRNALVNLVRRGDIGLDEAVRLAHEAERTMAGRAYAVLSDDVLHLAMASGCTAYDSEFVALAKDLDVPLVTSDEQVLRAFPSVAIVPAAFTRRSR